jgi:hypothetical protein
MRSTMRTRTLVTAVVGVFFAFSASQAQQPPPSQETTNPSNSTAQSAQSTPSAGKALIYAYRGGSMLGAAGYDHIYVNDAYFGTLHVSNYLQREVLPGTVVFACVPREKWIPGALLLSAITNSQNKKYERLKIDVEAGKTYYVRWHIGSKMNLVDETIGVKEMKGLHPAKD